MPDVKSKNLKNKTVQSSRQKVKKVKHMSGRYGGRQNRLNFGSKNNCNLNFKCGTRSFSVCFFEKRWDNKSHGNNDKFIADRHANVANFFRQRTSSAFVFRE